jgi:hypothetical protein
MPLQILPRETNWGESLGQGLGSGLSEGLQQLAHMKMQDYFQRNLSDLQQQVKMQEMQQQHDLLEKTLGPGWGNLAYLPEKYGLMAIQGGWSPAAPQTGMQQNLAALAPSGQVTAPTLPQASSGQVTAPTLPPEMQGPTVTSDLGQAIRQAAYNTPQMKQARELQAQQQAFATQQAERKEEEAFQKEIRKNFQKIDEKDKAILEAAHYAKRNLDIINQIGEKFPGSISGNMPEAIRSIFIRDPLVREYDSNLQKIVALSAQGVSRPNVFIEKIIASGKASLGQPLETQKALLNEVVLRGNEVEARKSFRESLAKDGRYPRDIYQRMKDYDSAIDNPLKYPAYYKKDTVIEEQGKRYRRIDKDNKPEWEEI